MRKRLCGVAVFAVLSACASNPQPVPVEGDRGSLANLTGEWSGTYAGAESGRSGSIVFRLEADADTAYGDVLMVPRASRPVPREGQPAAGPPEDLPEVIAIRFVEARADSVRGELDDYRDPDCGCQLRTVFEGQVSANRMEGTFRTWHLEGGEIHSGTWKVERTGP
ncbi:MAG: hypothetical protein ABFS14_02840 [Gemmatimonadota bacterium]